MLMFQFVSLVHHFCLVMDQANVVSCYLTVPVAHLALVCCKQLQVALHHWVISILLIL